MSIIDHTPRTRPGEPHLSGTDDNTTQPDGKPLKKSAVDLSMTQVVGGALAAMTAAAIGSQLSVAGTVIGAAVASVVAAVAGALYTASLRHTRAKVQTVFRGHVDSGLPVEVDVIQDAQTTAAAPVSAGSTALIATADAQGSPGSTPPTVRTTGRPARSRGRVQWKGALVGAVATFGIAGVALTGFELITGHSLSGGSGTTVEQVSHPQQTTERPTPTASASSESASPSESPSPSASDTWPSASTTDQPSQLPSESATEATQPTSEQPTEAPSSDPNATSTQTPTTGANAGTAPETIH